MELRVWQHKRLGQIGLAPESSRSATVTDACKKLRQLAESASRLATDAVVEAAARIEGFEQGAILPLLENRIKEAFKQSCLLVYEQDRILAAISETESGLMLGQDPGVLARHLATFIKCKTHQGEINL
jgi:hypothetical protein